MDRIRLFFCANTGVHMSTMETRSSALAGDLIVAEEPTGGWLLRDAAEVVMDDALVQDDGIGLIVEELDRCWEVTQDQDKASKIEKALFEAQRDDKMEMILMSYVARRKLNFQQLENALGSPLQEVIKGYATLRDAKLAESSYDKVVLWTGGSCDYDDVVRALVLLDRPGMRHRTALTRKWMHRHSFQVPRSGHNRVLTEHTGTRSSTRCKRTPISVMTER